eukprot:jgi/Botrbrau1/7702/Bobra.0159s0138.2
MGFYYTALDVRACPVVGGNRGTRANAGFSDVVRSVRPTKRSTTALQSTSAMEVFQLAGEGGEIAGVAAIMFAITLVGLAFGFVLLRVESLVEEGKL